MKKILLHKKLVTKRKAQVYTFPVNIILHGSLASDTLSLISLLIKTLRSKLLFTSNNEILPSHKKEFMIATCKNMKNLKIMMLCERNQTHPPQKREYILYDPINIKS